MKRKFNFQTRLIISYSVFMLIIILFSILFWGIQMISAHNTSIQNQIHLLLQNNDSEINNKFKEIRSVLYLHIYNPEIIDFLETGNTLSPSNIRSVEEGVIAQHNALLSMCLFDMSGNAYHTRYFREDSVTLYQYLEAAKGRNGIPYIGSLSFETINNMKKSVLTISKELISTHSGKPVGYVVVKIDSQKWFSSIDNTISEGFYTLITDENGKLLYKSNVSNDILNQDVNALIAGASDKYSFIHTNHYSMESIVNHYSRWNLYKIYIHPDSPLTSIFRGLQIFIPASFLIFLLTLGVAILVSRQLSSNINLLRTAFQKTTSAEDLKPVDKTLIKDDEVGILIRSYNHMIDRLHTAIDKEYHATIQAQEMRIKALNYQINPHFLYNNLNLISSIAILHDVPDVAHIARVLGDMFHYSIDASDTLTVKDELLNLQNYMELQKIRYPDKFNVIYDVDNTLLDRQCQKFILEPVVENIFSHGFHFTDNDSREYEIVISVSAEGHMLVYNILDNGEGISEQELRKLQDNLKSSANQYSSGHIGLWNIQKRIEAYYGEQYGIQICSEPGLFTQVTIRFPSQSNTPQK